MFCSMHNAERGKKCVLYLPVRRLSQEKCSEGNVKVVEQLGHVRYKYDTNHVDVNMDIIDLRDVLCTLMIVQNPFDMIHRNRKEQTFRDLPKDPDEKRVENLFEVKGSRYTSFPQSTC